MEITRSPEEILAQLTDGLRIIATRALGDRDAAQDAVQETLLRVLGTLRGKGLPDGYTLESYVYGTLRHVIGDAHRSRHRFLSLPDWLAWNDASPLDQLVDDQDAERIQRAMRTLDREDRALLRACYVEGEKVVDIARQLNQPPDRIRKRKSRALQRLRAALARLEGHIRPGSHD